MIKLLRLEEFKCQDCEYCEEMYIEKEYGKDVEPQKCPCCKGLMFHKPAKPVYDRHGSWGQWKVGS